MTTPTVTSSIDGQMHNNIMADSSRDRPSMLATGRYLQWRSRYKGKEIAKPITPPSESASEEDSDPEQAQRDKDMQKNLALIAKENVGSPVMQQSGIQCFNCKEFGHFAKECRKPKRVKDYAYHKEKMLLCKQAEKGVLLQAEKYDWLADTNEEIDEQELEAHYNYMAKIQEKANKTLAQELKECNTILAKTSKTLGESNSVWDSCLIALKNKHIEFEKYKAFNDRIIDYDKLELVKEKHDELIKQILLTKSHYEGLIKQKTKVITDLKLKEEHGIDKMLSMEKKLKFLNEIVYERSQSIQTIHMMAPKYAFPYDQSTHANRLIPDRKETLALERESRLKLNKDYDMEILIQTYLMPLTLKIQNDSFIFVHELKQEIHADLKYVESLEKEIDELESDKAEFSNTYDMILQECVSNEVMCSYLLSLSDLDALAELQCLYLYKVKECDCLAQKLSKQTESVSKEVHTEILQHFAKVEKHLISLEIALQKCKEQFAPVLGYEDLVQGNITINRVYYVKGLNHNLFSVGQFYDADLEVAFRKSTCFVRDLQGNDLLI
nr:integrase, catalytic region, zinc finger, CCHC-type, peptidase aspartic, catalytic [Tanacetum cinerariifolium]